VTFIKILMFALLIIIVGCRF